MLNTGMRYIIYMLLVVPNTEAALPSWSAMDTLWRRNERDWWSCVMHCWCLLISVSKLRASGPRAPEVSIAIGTKWWDPDIRAYFSHFLVSAVVATVLASLVASDMYDAAKVSPQVKSKTRHWPDFHGATEQPSGHLPSDLHWPAVGSRVDSTLTAASDLCTMAGFCSFCSHNSKNPHFALEAIWA